MKRSFLLLFFLVMILAAMTTRIGASESPSYTVSRDGDRYILTDTSTGISAASSVSLSDLLTHVGNSADLFFSSVTVDESLTLPQGRFGISGRLDFLGSSVLTVADGTALDLVYASLGFADGYLRVKGGSLTLSESEISAASTAVLLDYSDRASLTVTTGRISSSSASPTVRILRGTATLLGGAVENSGGTALLNSSALILGGTPTLRGIGYDLLTTQPITLSHGSSYFRGSVSIRYDRLFPDGALTEVFYSCDAAALANVTLTDREGREYIPEYFESSPYTDERNFSAIYLPYTVKLFDGDLVATLRVIEGERVTPPDYKAEDGYQFLGWYTADSTEPFSFDTPITSSLSLYAKKQLSYPLFSATSYNSVYDGAYHTVGFDCLYHPLDGRGGVYSYEWYKNGVYVSSASAITVRDVADSGRYSCKITYTHSGESVSVTADGITVAIAKAAVTLPEIPKTTYNGREQIPVVPPSSLYTVSATPAVSAGRYPVEFSLSDPANYRWTHTDSQAATAYLEIAPAANAWSEHLSVNDIYYGSAPTPRATPLFGKAEFLYSVTSDGSYTASIPTAIGGYYVRATVAATADYSGLCTEPMYFEILAESVVGLSVSTHATRLDYLAFDRFVPDGLTLVATYNSGRTETVTADRIAISYTSADSLRYGDRSVMLSFGGISLPYRVSVSRRAYDLTDLGFTDRTVIYSGAYSTVIPTATEIVGLDGIPLSFRTVGGGTDAGTYTVRLIFDTDSVNYLTPDELSVTLTVLPLTVTLDWQSTSFTYDGTPKSPIATYTDAFGARRTARVIGQGIKAALGYTATAVADPNYIFENPTVSFDVARADYDLTGAFWSADSFTYDGGYKRVTLSALPNGISVVGYTDNRAAECGRYLAVASVTYDSENYNPPSIPTHEWYITPAEYDMSSVVFFDTSVIYDGRAHYPTVSGSMPVGADGISPEYVFSASATNVRDGRVAVVISFSTVSKNYNAPADLVRYVEITPLAVTAEWQSTDFTYDGNPKTPTATSEYCKLSVIGGATSAGDYIATATSLDPNYTVANPTCPFTVRRADNGWLTTPSVSDAFAGTTPTPTATPIYGSAEFLYFSDPDLTTPANLAAPGSYYMIAHVPESENYNAMTSAPIPFSVIAVVPIGISAEYQGRTPRAFERLDLADVICYLDFSDGTRTPVSSDSLAVVYQHGDSLRRSDSSVTVCYADFSAIIPISVDYADYDLSGVRWEQTAATYDGTTKTPILVGLPSGITVLGYAGGGVIAAGEYLVSANLDYDSENYNPPEIGDALLTVSPATVKIPSLSPLTYCGKPHTLASPSSLYTLTASAPLLSAGEYTLTATLTDSANYRFENGATAATISLSILPKAVTVTVSDLTVYLFETVGEAALIIGDGIADGDSLRLVQRVLDGRVTVECDDPNYQILVVGGNITYLSYPSPDALRIIAIGILLLLLLLLVAIVIFLRRRDILSAIAAYRSRVAYSRRRPSPPESPKAACAPDDPSPTATPSDLPESDETVDDPEDAPDLAEEYLTAEIPAVEIDMEKADDLITDGLAKELLKKDGEIVVTSGREQSIINVDTLSKNFLAGERVDVNVLKRKSLVPYDTAYIKVLARGVIDKPLRVYANDFSLSAIKMIALTGGEAVKVVTVKEKWRK